MGKLLDNPITTHDFQQLTLVANLIAIRQIALKRELVKSKTRQLLSDLLMRVKRVEASIPGHLNERSIIASEVFYNDLTKSVDKFLVSFIDGPPTVARNAKGKFIKLKREEQ